MVNLREAVLLATYEPHKLRDGMTDLIEWNLREWVLLIERKKKDLESGGIKNNDLLDEQMRQVLAMGNHYKKNLGGHFDRRKWMCKHFGMHWKNWHQPRPGIVGYI